MKEAVVIKFEILICSWMEGLIANTKIGALTCIISK